MKKSRDTYLFLITTALTLASCGKIPLPWNSQNSSDATCTNYEGQANSRSGKRMSMMAPRTTSTQIRAGVAYYPDCKALQDDFYPTGDDTNYYGSSTPYDLPAAVSDMSPPEGACAAGQRINSPNNASVNPVAAESMGTAQNDVASAAAGQDGKTNVQEKGVDEADFVKVGDHQIYVQRGEQVQVSTRDGAAVLGALDLKGMRGVTLYADGDDLIATGAVAPDPASPNEQWRWDTQRTRIAIFHAESGKLPVLTKEMFFSGVAADSRYVAGRLVMIFQTYAQADQVTDNGMIQDVQCNQVVRPADDGYDARFTKIVSLNTKNLDEAPQVVGALGGADQIYMTETSLYLGKSVYITPKSGGDVDEYPGAEQFMITKIAFDPKTGAISPVASGVVDGRVKDQWAFKELSKDGETYLSLATTTGQLWSQGDSAAQNHLFILHQNKMALEVVAKVDDFGAGEDIRSVRYLGNLAYVVTFKKTDPLFAIDLSDPLTPKMLGELQMPGFSTYMHPVGAGLVLGVGFDANDVGDFAWYQGLQVSLFDVTNPMDMKRVDNKILGQRGSSSEVTADHHAFFFDPELKLVALPLVELNGKAEDTGPEMATHLAFSGAVFYKIGDASLTEAGRISHADLVPPSCASQIGAPRWWEDGSRSLDVNRIYYLEGKLVSVSRFGIKALDPAHLDGAPVAQVAFPDDDGAKFCSSGPLLPY